MNEITKRKLNSTQTIIDNLPKLIEAFVSFYGEKEREFIEDKFKNIYFYYNALGQIYKKLLPLINRQKLCPIYTL